MTPAARRCSADMTASSCRAVYENLGSSWADLVKDRPLCNNHHLPPCLPLPPPPPPLLSHVHALKSCMHQTSNIACHLKNTCHNRFPFCDCLLPQSMAFLDEEHAMLYTCFRITVVGLNSLCCINYTSASLCPHCQNHRPIASWRDSRGARHSPFPVHRAQSAPRPRRTRTPPGGQYRSAVVAGQFHRSARCRLGALAPGTLVPPLMTLGHGAVF